MAEFVQMTVNGLVLGTTLAMFVLGFSLLMGVIQIFNMAHAAFYATSGMGIWWLSQRADLNYWLTIIIVVAGMGLIGIIVERIVYRPFRGNLMQGIVVAMGFMFFMDGALRVTLIETEISLTQKAIPNIMDGVLHFGGADIAKDRVLIICISVLVILAVMLFLSRTKTGWAIQATAMDSEASLLQGIRVGTVSMIVMMVATMLVAAAAGLMGPVYGAHPGGGFEWLMKGMVAITLGGLGSIGGTLWACLILGLVESYATTKIGGNEAIIILFAILAVILLFRPTGLAGKAMLEEMT